MSVKDIGGLSDYARRVRPLMERHGGELLAVSERGVRVIEGDRRPNLIALQRWPSHEAFDSFWRSPDYAPLRNLRRASADTEIFVFDSLQKGDSG